jgi:hypothetical protein
MVLSHDLGIAGIPSEREDSLVFPPGLIQALSRSFSRFFITDVSDR